MQLLHEILMPLYPREVKTAENRRPKYIKHIDREIPKKYCLPNKITKSILFNKDFITIQVPEPKEGLSWKQRNKKEICLFNENEAAFVIKNSRTANTQRWTTINGQKIYNGEYHPQTRRKIMEYIHDWMISFLEGLDVITTFPLHIVCEVHDYKIDDKVKVDNWDVGNRSWPFCKAFDDLLQELKIIPNDNINYITTPSHPKFVELKYEDRLVGIEPHLIFKIYHDANNS